MMHMLKYRICTVICFLLVYILTCTNSYAYFKNDSYIDDIDIAFIHSRITKFEGFRSYRYKCKVSGVYLQGYGKRIYNKNFPSSISENTARVLLYLDIMNIITKLNHHFDWYNNLSIVRKMAMIDLVYNMGIYKLKKFKKFLYHMEHRQYTKASNELKNSLYYRQTGIRAKEIISAIRHDRWTIMKL